MSKINFLSKDKSATKEKTLFKSTTKPWTSPGEGLGHRDGHFGRRRPRGVARPRTPAHRGRKQNKPSEFRNHQKKVPRPDVMNFTRQLAVSCAPGSRSWRPSRSSSRDQNKMLKAILNEMVDSLRAGDTFAASAAAHPEAFPSFYVGILESAELTGNLDNVLNQLADYIDRDVKARGKVTAALIYPAVVAAMSVVTVLVLAVFVMPRFEVFFASLHAKLPLVTECS